MVKIFIGNLPDGGLVSNEDVRPLFETFGAVTECEIIKNYGFVHMDSESAAQEAIRSLNGVHDFSGRKMKVEASDNKGQSRRNTQKLFVGNISDGTTDAELRTLFERFGRVVEADVMTDKNFGFVHVDAGIGRGKMNDLLRELHGAELNGNKLRVQLSTSGVRQEAGMGGGDECFKYPHHLITSSPDHPITCSPVPISPVSVHLSPDGPEVTCSLPPGHLFSNTWHMFSGGQVLESR